MLKIIEVKQLRRGMYLEKMLGPWLDHPFWRGSFLLDKQEDLQKISASKIEHIQINTSKGLGVEEDAKTTPPRKVTTKNPKLTSTNHASTEYNRAKKICESSLTAVESMFSDVRMGKVANPQTALPLVKEISSSLLRNPDAMISISRLKTKDNYTYMHSVAVCALMVNLARRLGLDETQIHDAGWGGILHDLGKALMPMKVLNKPGILNNGEFRIIKTHPQQGFDMLQQKGSVSPETLDIVLHHHEKTDGSGYPHGLAGGDISVLARMAAICDVYDAITSTRPYKQGWDPAISIKRMATWNGHFDQTYFSAFVKSIGIYPVGSLVALASKQLAVVLQKGGDSLLTPKVRIFYSLRSKQTITPKVIDLDKSIDRIVNIEDPKQWGFRNLENMWLDQ